MKNFKPNQFCFIAIALILTSSVFSVSAQIITDTKVNKQVIANKNNIGIKPVNLTDSIPYFKNIRPVTLTTTNKNIISNKNLKPVGKLPKRDFNFTPSSVNGTMTARDPYLNNLAYVEFINGTVLSGEDKVNCSCSSPLTFVKLVLTATAGKDYMVTTKVSPRNGNSFGLDLFSNGFVHRSNVNSNEDEVKIILSSQTSGKIELWMQCSDPNGARRPWTFHSLSVQEVD